MGVERPKPPNKPAVDLSDIAAPQKKADIPAYAAAIAGRVAARDAKLAEQLEEHEVAMGPFNEALEAARAKVDRMAKIGVVPVNVYEGNPGDFVVPSEGPDDTIIAIVVPADKLTMRQYLRSVGKITRVLDDGRREVEVKAV